MTTSTTAPATRTIDGIEIPVAGTWKIDPGHADVAFIGRHFMLTKVRGHFTDVRGEIELADDPERSRIAVVIGTASVSSGSADRDDHLRSADLFDVERFPEMTFTSTAIDWDGSSATVIGDLAIRDTTRAVALHVDYLGATIDPWGNARAIYSASTEIDREDWGLTWNMALEAGGVLVSKRIRIEIDIETILEP